MDYLFLLVGRFILAFVLLACLNPYFIGLPILICDEHNNVTNFLETSQSLFYWITYSYHEDDTYTKLYASLSQSLFYWITYSYYRWQYTIFPFISVSILILLDYLFLSCIIIILILFSWSGLNPYFIGLPILIMYHYYSYIVLLKWSQSLFYWITYSYNFLFYVISISSSLNPYFIGLPILITSKYSIGDLYECLNPYFIGLPILILRGFVW